MNEEEEKEYLQLQIYFLEHIMCKGTLEMMAKNDFNSAFLHLKNGLQFYDKLLGKIEVKK